MTITRVTPTTKRYVADAGWNEVGSVGKPSFQNSWVNYGGTYATAAYRIDAEGWVHLKGLIKSGTSAATAFVLPSGYRPKSDAHGFHGPAITNNQSGHVSIDAAGNVVPVVVAGSTSFFSLDGVRFPAWENSSEFSPDRFARLPLADPYSEKRVPALYRTESGVVIVQGLCAAGSPNCPIPNGWAPTVGQIGSYNYNAGSGIITTEFSSVKFSGTIAGWKSIGGNAWTLPEIDDDIITPTFLNSWTAYGAGAWNVPGYFKDRHGFVHFRGGMLSSGSSATAYMFTLPLGYRPADNLIFHTQSSAGTCRLDVLSTGDVAAAAGGSTGWTGIPSVSFYVG